MDQIRFFVLFQDIALDPRLIGSTIIGKFLVISSKIRIGIFGQ